MSRGGKHNDAHGSIGSDAERDVRMLAAFAAWHAQKPKVREPIWMWRSEDRAETPGMHRTNEGD